MDSIKIRDHVIPNGKTEIFAKYLLTNKLTQMQMETFLGTAIAYSNSIIISMCNLYLRENPDIQIDRMSVLEQIYCGTCRKCSSANPGYMISYGTFDGEIVDVYIGKYWKIFDM